jgi:hypothetical protein
LTVLYSAPSVVAAVVATDEEDGVHAFTTPKAVRAATAADAITVINPLFIIDEKIFQQILAEGNASGDAVHEKQIICHFIPENICYLCEKPKLS